MAQSASTQAEIVVYCMPMNPSGDFYARHFKKDGVNLQSRTFRVLSLGVNRCAPRLD